MSAYPPGFLPDSDEVPPRKPASSAAAVPPAVVVHQNHSHAYHGITAKQIGLGCAGSAIALFVGLVLLLLVAAAVHGPGPKPVPTAKVKQEGKAFARDVLVSFAESLDTARKEILEGEKDIKAIHSEHTARWQKGREQAFNSRFQKPLDEIVPPGSKSKEVTIEQRRHYGEYLQDIEDGVKEQAK